MIAAGAALAACSVDEPNVPCPRRVRCSSFDIREHSGRSAIVAWAARIRFLTEARLEDAGSGLAPVTGGWFVVNVRDAEWFTSEKRGAACWFANEYGDSPVEFPQFGINVTVLEPGQSSVYHAESNQEAFLVLGGECRLLVEGEERRLRAWDFFHSPPWTEHAFVGAGDRPCAILMVGAHVESGSALPRLGTRGALRGERGDGDIRSGAGLCDSRAVPARAAPILVPPALGLEPGLSLRGTFPHAGASVADVAMCGRREVYFWSPDGRSMSRTSRRPRSASSIHSGCSRTTSSSGNASWISVADDAVT